MNFMNIFSFLMVINLDFLLIIMYNKLYMAKIIFSCFISANTEVSYGKNNKSRGKRGTFRIDV